jgi:tetratricopeptide (TPR) repeat protein
MAAPAARADDPATAEALFQAAKALADAGKWEEACPKFKASYQLDRQLGTLLNLANCYQEMKKLAQAWARWNEAVEWARRDNDKRLAWIEEQRDKVVPRLPKLVVHVEHPVPELSVRHDETPLPPASYGIPLAVDPGPLVVYVQRGDQILDTRELNAEETKTTEVTLDLAAIAKAHPPPKPPPPKPPPPPPKKKPRAPYDPTQRIAGIVVGAVGLAALLTAGGLEIAALVKKGQADEPDACVNRFCSPQGLDAAEEGERFAEVGQWLGIAGIGVLAVGVTVLLTAPSEEDPAGASLQPWLSPRAAGMTLRW